MHELSSGVLWDKDGFSDYQQFLLLCLRGLSEDIDLVNDNDQPLVTEARELAEPINEECERKETECYVVAAQQIFDWTFLRFLIQSEGGTDPGAPDGPLLRREADAA